MAHFAGLTSGAAVLVLGTLGAAGVANSQPLDAQRVAVSPPVPRVAFTTAETRGFPVLLAWSPDGRQVSIRVVHRDRWANEKSWSYVVTLDSPRFLPVEREPEWAGAYWLWKSQLACPGQPDFRIEVETRVERKTATASGAGGSIAQNAGDPYGAGFELGPQGQAIVQGAWQAQQVSTTTIRLKGAVLGEFVNTSPMFGLMYAWAPGGLGAIAFAGPKRGLIIMDRNGHRHDVRGTKGVLLPAWSPDGRRLAWLVQQGRSKFSLMVADITTR